MKRWLGESRSAKSPRRVRGKANRSERGGAFLETALLAPVVFMFIFGSVGLYLRVRVKNALESAIGEALLMSDLNMTPERGSQTLFTERYVLADGGKIMLTADANNSVEELDSPVPADSLYCKQNDQYRGMEEASCGATWAIMTAWRAIHSAQIGGIIEYVDATVKYEDVPVESGMDVRFSKNRKINIELTANWKSNLPLFLRADGPLTVARTEAVG